LHIPTGTNEVVKILIWFTGSCCRWLFGLPFRGLSPCAVQGLIWQFVMPGIESCRLSAPEVPSYQASVNLNLSPRPGVNHGQKGCRSAGKWGQWPRLMAAN